MAILLKPVCQARIGNIGVGAKCSLLVNDYVLLRFIQHSCRLLRDRCIRRLVLVKMRCIDFGTNQPVNTMHAINRIMANAPGLPLTAGALRGAFAIFREF